jgi:hypothetical protein
MKRIKTYLIGLIATCIICTNILYLVNSDLLDEKGPIDIGQNYISEWI